MKEIETHSLSWKQSEKFKIIQCTFYLKYAFLKYFFSFLNIKTDKILLHWETVPTVFVSTLYNGEQCWSVPLQWRLVGYSAGQWAGTVLYSGLQ